MTLTVTSPDNGTATEEVASEYSSSDPLEIGFNAGYLKDILSQIDSDTVETAPSRRRRPHADPQG